MTVEVALGSQHTYHFNESRLERVLTANTLDEAGKMGLLDKILDWFRGGVKLEAIQALYQQVTQPGVLTPSQVAQRFCALRNLAVDQHQTKFKLALGDNGEQWRMLLSIGGRTIYQTDNRDIDTHFYQVAAVKTTITASDDLRKMASSLTLEKYIEGNIQCMSDNQVVQQALRNSLTDPRFSSEKFTGILPNDSEAATFVAQFGDLQWTFSNRAETNGEFRGGLLKNALSSNDYKNIGDLVAKGFMSCEDNFLRYAVTPSRYELLNYVTAHGMEDEGLIRVLYQAKVGNTNLGALYGLPAPKDAPQLDNFDDFVLCDENINLGESQADVYADEATFYQGIGQHQTTTIGDNCYKLLQLDINEGLHYLATKANPYKFHGGMQNAFDYLVGRNSGAIALRNCITCAKAVDVNMGLMLARQNDSVVPLKFWEAIDTRAGVISQVTAQSQTIGLSPEQSVSSLLFSALPQGKRAIVTVPVSGGKDSHAMNFFHFDSGKCFLVDGQNGKSYDLQHPEDRTALDSQYNAQGRDLAPITLHTTGDLPKL
ncbi:hypothetical protein KO537_21685 [Shewanella sp. NKUCC01_JLK]|uniref:hypothetical protein n=1 Tax=unclassified Shewanella TaxID=196818 RepID=UPI001565ED1A|nr:MULTISPECIES: hypothetical protein [unclassified Shewanella]MBW3517305.1 hypothetical protein [Shewanella sp. NKUCC01_JLK]NRD33309.1 hypothetical protein [Shewanella sp. DC2-4]